MAGKLSVLVGEKPREKSGSKTAARYDFQVHVSILRVLELYKGSDPFVALFDHFDDLVLIVGPVGAERLTFLQIKSKEDGFWKLSNLVSRPKKALIPKSIIGKVYQNVERFENLTESASVVSNAPIKLKLSDATDTGMDDQQVSFQKLADTDHKKVVRALEADFGAPLKLDYRKTISFERVPLDLASFQQTVKGHVAEFLESQGLHGSVAVSPAYDALHSDLMRRTGNTITCETLDDLYARKAIDRDGVAELLARVSSRAPSVLEWWPTLQPELQGSLSGLGLLKLRAKCLAYWSAKTLAAPAAVTLCREIKAAIAAAPPSAEAPLLDQVQAVAQGAAFSLAADAPYDLQSAVLVELAEEYGA